MFKQKSGFWFSKNYPELKWQKDFYDHIIRNDKDIENQIYYILKNQMRENIIEIGRIMNIKVQPYMILMNGINYLF